MNSYYKILNIVKKKNRNINLLSFDSINNYLFRYLSNFLVPPFIIFRFSANSVTFLSLLFVITSFLIIIVFKESYFSLGIFFYFVFRIIDYIDGSVARYNNNSNFFGRFFDSIIDISSRTFLLLILSFHASEIFSDKKLLIFGALASIMAAFYNFIYDKYSALARWSNEENRTNIIPYIRRIFYPRIIYSFDDFFYFFLFLLIFVNHQPYFYFIIYMLFITSIVQGLYNIFLHVYVAYINFNIKAKNKKLYLK
jgi:phosphatidylglycerophosphate synthase